MQSIDESSTLQSNVPSSYDARTSRSTGLYVGKGGAIMMRRRRDGVNVINSCVVLLCVEGREGGRERAKED